MKILGIISGQGNFCAYPLKESEANLISSGFFVAKLTPSDNNMTGSWTLLASSPGNKGMAPVGLQNAAPLDLNAGGANGTAICFSWDWPLDWANVGPQAEMQLNLLTPTTGFPTLNATVARNGNSWTFDVYSKASNVAAPVTLGIVSGSGTLPTTVMLRFAGGTFSCYLDNVEVPCSPNTWATTSMIPVITGSQLAEDTANTGKTFSGTLITSASAMPVWGIPAGTVDPCGKALGWTFPYAFDADATEINTNWPLGDGAPTNNGVLTLSNNFKTATVVNAYEGKQYHAAQAGYLTQTAAVYTDVSVAALPTQIEFDVVVPTVTSTGADYTSFTIWIYGKQPANAPFGIAILCQEPMKGGATYQIQGWGYLPGPGMYRLCLILNPQAGTWNLYVLGTAITGNGALGTYTDDAVQLILEGRNYYALTDSNLSVTLITSPTEFLYTGLTPGQRKTLNNAVF